MALNKIDKSMLNFNPATKEELTTLSDSFDSINNVVNITDFGGKFDGTDSTDALLAAINAANNGTTKKGGWKRAIYIPGRITVKSAIKISLPGSFKIFGNDFNNSAITFTDPNGGFVVDRYVNSVSVNTFELHFENITLSGNNTCATLLDANKLANFRFEKVYIGGTTSHPVKIKDSGILWFKQCTLDGAYGDSAKVRTQRGLYFENCGMVVHDDWNIWNVKEGFYTKGYLANFQINKGNWVENCELLMDVYPDSSDKITSLNIQIKDSYILNSSSGQSYSWNLLKLNTTLSTIVSDAFIKINDNRIYNISGTAYNGDCVLNLNTFSSGEVAIAAKGNHFAGISKPSPVKFTNIQTSFNFKYKFYDFSGNTQFSMNDAGVDSSYATARSLEMGRYARPIAGSGVKLWSDYGDSVEGTLKYDNAVKAMMMYNGSNGATDYRYIPDYKTGSTPPSTSADHVGQIYIDLTNKQAYMAISVGGASADWKQITN